jgi:hypothetical protein
MSKRAHAFCARLCCSTLHVPTHSEGMQSLKGEIWWCRTHCRGKDTQVVRTPGSKPEVRATRSRFHQPVTSLYSSLIHTPSKFSHKYSKDI